MTDVEQSIQLVQRTGREALTVDQCMALHLSCARRPLEGEGVKVLIVGTVMPYTDEVAAFHPALAHELIRRVVAVLA